MGTLLQVIGGLGIVAAVALLAMAGNMSGEGQGAMAAGAASAGAMVGLAAFGLIAAGSVIARLTDTARNSAESVRLQQKMAAALDEQNARLKAIEKRLPGSEVVAEGVTEVGTPSTNLQRGPYESEESFSRRVDQHKWSTKT